MEKISSFLVDHTKLRPGLYVSRRDRLLAEDESFIKCCPSCKKGCDESYATVVTFDLRFVAPNTEPISHAAAHTIEHIGATFLRSQEGWGKRVVYFGPMGCFTGFYLIMHLPAEASQRSVVVEDHKFKSVYELVRGMLAYITSYPGDQPIPGASSKECGNWKNHDLQGAKLTADAYLDVLCDDNLGYDRYNYPT